MSIYKYTIKSSQSTVGYYKFNNVFQILPNENLSTLTENWLDIEFNTEYFKENETLNENLEQLNFLKILLSLVSIVTNSHCYDPNDCWSYQKNEGTIINEFSSIENLIKLPFEKNRIYHDMNSTRSFLAIQSDVDTYFNKYFSLDSKAKNRYNASIFLYYNMQKVRLTSPSLAVVGYISAIENLTDYEASKLEIKAEVCSECKQTKYSVAKKFKSFMSQYSDFENKEEINAILNKIYSKRSKISHAGALMEMDFIQSKFHAEEYRYLVNLQKLIRVALYRYIVENI